MNAAEEFAGHVLCLCCGTEHQLTGPVECCPSCGCREHLPADLDEMLSITITGDELRILTFWAANHGRTLGMGEAHDLVATIVDRLSPQTTVPLSLSQEVANLRAHGWEVQIEDEAGNVVEL